MPTMAFSVPPNLPENMDTHPTLNKIVVVISNNNYNHFKEKQILLHDYLDSYII